LERYTILDHTADVAVLAEADSREGLITASIQALADILGLGDPPDDRSLAEGFSLRGEGETLAEQLVNLLNEWLYSAETKQVWPVITATMWEDHEARVLIEVHEIDGIRPPVTEVKAVTFHNALVLPPEEDTGPLENLPGVKLDRRSGPSLWRAHWVADL
jgi:SHS2 domain-containing protein